MKVLMFCILKIIFDFPTATAQGDFKCVGSNAQPVLCHFRGKAADNSSYTFNIADVREGCNIVVYSYYFIDGDWGEGHHVVQEDQTTIKTLIEAKKEVYIIVGFMHDDGWWNVFYPPDDDQFTAMRNKLVKFLNEFNVSGIILDSPKIYNGPSNLAAKINSFASGVKSLTCELKIGLIIDGTWYEDFTNDENFSFTITNENVDLYIVDTTIANECNAETKKTGVVPISSDNKNLISLGQISCATLQSAMDKCRIYARMELSVRMPTTKGSISHPTSYSEYCSVDSEVKSQLCAQTSKMLYENAQFVKAAPFQGIMLSYMEAADFDDKCGCGPFSALNKILDGWENKPLQNCEKIDSP